MSTAPNIAQRGMDCQRRAMDAFQNGRFQEAYHLYIEAEALYREARDTGEYWVTTRLFFMQSSVLRCLEELIDESPDLLGSYRSRAQKFLDEWSEGEISANISRNRVFEALAFRAWREGHLKGVHDFSAAAVALKKGDAANARRILEDFIERTKEGGGQENDALYALARSKIEMLRTQQERQKRPQERNPRIVVSGYLRAARVSRLPVKSTSNQRKRFSGFRALFLSEALKFRAFDLLRQMRVPEPSLIKAERYLARAVQYARTAASLSDFPQCHTVYLGYWHELVSERVYLMAFMSRGNPADFDAALRAWQNALKAAKQLCEHADEESFFPNRFYSLDDLRLEGEFLAAARAFREKRWRDCARLLESWQQKLPQEFSWSWRDVNVSIRLLGAKTIDAITSGDNETLPSLCRDLMNASKSEPAGGAARYFADGVVRLPEIARKQLLLNTTLDSLAEYFPLDSWVDSFQEPDNLDRFASLPERIHHNLAIALPATEADVEQAKRTIPGAIEAFLGYMCDYYAQASTPISTVPEPDIHKLIDRCRQIPFQWAQRPEFQGTIESLRAGIDKMLSASATEAFDAAYGNVRSTLQNLVRFVPVIVDLRSTVLRVEQPYALEAFPDWAIDRVGRQMLYVFVSPIELASMTTGRYYVKPAWRRANRLSYKVDQEHALYPVRFVPRWDYWETEAANASFLFSEGVLLEHVRTAIELSKLCNDSPQKPKVGAVIVKGRTAIAQAFRGEDGSDRHAEEIAIGKCTRDQLRDAIMVTTLEPCEEHGRSTTEVSCAVRIRLNGFSKVVIGIPDPDKRIQSWGDKYLRANHIAVAYVPSALAEEIREINRQFVTDRTKGDFEEGVFAKV